MNQELWETLEELFLQASQLAPYEQSRFIKERTEGNQELADELRRLLRGHNQRSVLDNDVVLIAAEVFDEPEVVPLDAAGPYKLMNKLGAGGMGVVYLANREDWQVKVAIKIPRDILISSDHLHRFAYEQRVLAQLVHPSIARIYEGGTLANGTPWFAMEYVDGEPITSYCRKHNLSVPERLQLFLAVCDAVQYAHSQTVIHRDLKPSNILVSPNGQIKLLDFGIAKQLVEDPNSTAFTQTKTHPVTLAYAAPEQILNNEISTRTDIYSLGVILYEMVVGKLPFDFAGLRPSQAEEVIRAKEPQAPSSSIKRIAGMAASRWSELDVLILTAMHKDVKQRYGSVDALIRDVNHFLTDDPLDAHADTASYQLKKFVVRHRKSISFGVAASLALVGLIAIHTVKLAKARDLALKEAARTRLVMDFTRNVFAGDDSEYGPSKDLRVIDMLDRGLKKAESLKADPIQQAEIFTTIGSLFTSRGEFGKADAALHSAYRILAASAPISHDLSQVLMGLGELYSVQSQDRRSLICLQRAFAIAQQVVPPDKKLLFRSEAGVAYALLEPDPKAAAAMLNDLLKQPASATDDEGRATVWQNLATAYINIGEYAKAEPYAKRVLAYSEKVRPAVHPDIAIALINVAQIQKNLGDYRDAEQNLRKTLAIDMAWYPQGHPETGDVRRILANVLFLEGRFAEAMPLARQALAEEQKGYGKLNRRTAYAMQLVGVLDLTGGDLAEAESMFKQEIAALQVLKDPTNQPVAFSYLGDVYAAEKIYKLAEQAYRNSAALYGASLVPAAGYLAKTNRKLGETLMFEGQYAAAEAPLLASYKFWIASPTPYPEELKATREDLVKDYAALNRQSDLQKFQQ